MLRCNEGSGGVLLAGQEPRQPKADLRDHLGRKRQAKPNQDDADTDHRCREHDLTVRVEVREVAANAKKDCTDDAEHDTPEPGRTRCRMRWILPVDRHVRRLTSKIRGRRSRPLQRWVGRHVPPSGYPVLGDDNYTAELTVSDSDLAFTDVCNRERRCLPNR